LLEISLELLVARNHSDQTLPWSIKSFPVSELDEALSYAQQADTKGHAERVVVIAAVKDRVKVIPREPKLRLLLGKENASYLVVGDVGGLGGAIALWMASQGMRSIAILSEDTEDDAEAPILAKEAAEHGSSVRFISCDVSNEESMAVALGRASASLPPIRGVVYASIAAACAVSCYHNSITPHSFFNFYLLIHHH
jgi:hypothetical protein